MSSDIGSAFVFGRERKASRCQSPAAIPIWKSQANQNIRNGGAQARSLKLIFDRSKPERPKVDRTALDFVKSLVFDAADFSIHADAVSRLNPRNLSKCCAI